MGYDAVAMEDYVATGQNPPLDKCLADVAECEWYVGIFAWRYGYIPVEGNSEERSITELEYRQAEKLGKPCFIFLLDEDAPWSRKQMDAVTGDGERGDRINQLRQELGKTKLVSFFKNPDQLASLVSAAINKWEKEHSDSQSQHKEQATVPSSVQYDMRGATIYGLVPGAAGSTVVSGHSVEGNTIIGTQNNGSQASGQKPKSAGDEVVELWRERLAAFQREEALASDPEKKFQLKKLIQECQQKIEECKEKILELSAPNFPVSQPEKSLVVSGTAGVSYYVERPPIEAQCYQEIFKDGALIRIKAPQKMGKTWLMNRIFEYAAQQGGYQTVFFDLLEPEEAVLSDLDELLKYFCSAVSWRLGLTDKVDQYWQKKRAKTLKCRRYFEREILEKLKEPLVLGLDNVDEIFSPKFQLVAADFFGMLRSWYGNGQTLSTWKKLRLLVVYATEDLPNLGVYQSPFNVGREIKLPEWTAPQIMSLAQQYGLNWSEDETEKLMALVGGHPYLVHEALNYLATYKYLKLEDLLQKAPTDEGLYCQHLQSYWSVLEKDEELARIFQVIVTSPEPVSIAPKLLYKLESMGLIGKESNQVKPRCQLYRLYFQAHLEPFF